jgi:hypothetical protein
MRLPLVALLSLAGIKAALPISALQPATKSPPKKNLVAKAHLSPLSLPHNSTHVTKDKAVIIRNIVHVPFEIFV